VTVEFNRIVGNTASQGTAIYSTSGTVNATLNWWGTNFEGTNPITAGIVTSDVLADPWIVLTLNASPTSIPVGDTSTVIADLTHDNTGAYHDPALGHVPDGIPVSFTDTLGTVNPINTTTINGSAATNFIGFTPGVAVLSATIDGYTESTDITIGSVDMYVLQYPWYYDTASGTYENTYSYDNMPVFTVDVRNYGNDDATGVVVNYVIGKGFQYIGSTTQGVGTALYNSDTGTITWNLGSLSKNGMAWMMVALRVIETGSSTPDLTNTATLTHVDQYDVPNNYKTASYSIIVPSAADVQVSQTQSTYTSNGNEYVTYTISTTNNGPNTATGVSVTDLLPAGLTYISSSPSQGTYNPTTGVWTIGSINNGGVDTLTLTAEITATSGIITNTATKTAENEQDPNYTNNEQTLDLTISGIYTPQLKAYISATVDNQAVQKPVTINTIPPTVNANPTGGLYNTTKTVTLKMSEPGTIYYTTNGTTPTVKSSKYSTPITITSTTILKYLAVNLAGNKSPVYSQTYTIDKVPPKVSSTSPVNKASGVSLTSPITIKFTENITAGTTYSKI
jgi:uncharacterized repeat protein (TIGR01451 family)